LVNPILSRQNFDLIARDMEVGTPITIGGKLDQNLRYPAACFDRPNLVPTTRIANTEQIGTQSFLFGFNPDYAQFEIISNLATDACAIERNISGDLC
jgi:hypothetical protein